MYKMEKKLCTSFILFVLFCTPSLVYTTTVQSLEQYLVTYNGSVLIDSDIIIPDDYPTIQQGIDNAQPGDTIFVRSGRYRENIVINKEKISIRGENKFDTIIDGGKITDTLEIMTSNVTIQGFTIINGWNEDPYLWDVSGIKIFSPDVTINDNIITLNRLGINVLATATNLIITNNTFIDDGILLGNWEYTFHVRKESFLHTITNNTVNGRPLYYYKNHHDFIVPYDAGQVILAGCTNVTVKNLYITSTDFAIILGDCHRCIIKNVVVDKTDGEIILFLSENNTLENNSASRSLHGICLDYESHNNTVRNNTVSDNWVGLSAMNNASNNLFCNNTVLNNNVGIMLIRQAHHNVISENEIIGGIYGIRLAASDNNVITNNSLRNNRISASFQSCLKNSWQHNYWNRPRLLPKIIFGSRIFGKIVIPWINIDPYPARVL
jgi:parallel beta-helix repeat protein